MSEVTRVLHVVRKMDMGGVQSMLMNYYRNVNKDRVQFDFVVQDREKGVFDCEINALGGKVHYVSSLKNLKQYYIDMHNLLKTNNYNIVHVHQNFANIHTLLIAFINSVDRRISHSHNAVEEKRLIRRVLNIFIKKGIRFFSTDLLACSIKAGCWLYGEKYCNCGKVIVINNAIEVDRFRYNEESRKRYRMEFNIGDEEVLLGHIGHFNQQKNHKFLVKIFYELSKINSNVKLILIGKGKFETEIRKMTDDYGLTDKIIFLGVRKDVNQIYSAMDIFLLPSLHEGLPVTVVEAQAATLPCLLSNVITNEIELTELVEYCSLEESAEKWASNIHNLIKNHELGNRPSMQKIIRAKHYDIINEAKILENFYSEIRKKS